MLAPHPQSSPQPPTRQSVGSYNGCGPAGYVGGDYCLQAPLWLSERPAGDTQWSGVQDGPPS